MASILERDLGLWGKIIAHVDGKFIRYGDSPDFINAPPKLRFTVRLIDIAIFISHRKQKQRFLLLNPIKKASINACLLSPF